MLVALRLIRFWSWFARGYLMSSYKEMPKAVVIVFVCRILGEFQATGHVLDIWFLLKALILILSWDQTWPNRELKKWYKPTCRNHIVVPLLQGLHLLWFLGSPQCCITVTVFIRRWEGCCVKVFLPELLCIDLPRLVLAKIDNNTINHTSSLEQG